MGLRNNDLEGIGLGINFTTSSISAGTYTHPKDLVLVVYSTLAPSNQSFPDRFI